MSLTTVQHTLTSPLGAPLASQRVSVALVGPGFDGTRAEVLGSDVLTTDGAGSYSMQLRPNSELETAGTYYRVHHPANETLEFIVPVSGSAVTLRSCLVEDPASPGGIVGVSQAGLALAMTGGVPAADGQLMAWSQGLGRWTPVNPTGQSRLASAQNVTGAPTTASATAGALGTAVDIPGTAISVSASGGRPVTLRFSANVVQTVAGTGEILLSLVETTAGAVSLMSALKPLPGSASTQPAYTSANAEFDIGVVTTPRTFKLQLQLWGGTGSPSAQTLNVGNNPTWLRAVAE